MSNIRKSIKISKFEKKKYHCRPLRSLLKAPQRRGTAMKFRIMTPKKPNSAKRRIVRIILSNRYWVTAKIKGYGHTLQVYSEVLACGGRANDLPGVRYNMIKGGSYGFSYKESFVRKNSPSKYGRTLEDRYFAIQEENEKKLELLNQQEILSDEEIDYKNKNNLNFPLMQNKYAEFGDELKIQKKFARFLINNYKK